MDIARLPSKDPKDWGVCQDDCLRSKYSIYEYQYQTSANGSQFSIIPCVQTGENFVNIFTF